MTLDLLLLCYPKPLFGFVTSRKATDEKTNIALAYQYQTARSQANQGQQQRNLAEF